MRASTQVSRAFQSERQTLSAAELDAILLKELREVHTDEELAQIRTLLLRKGTVYKSDMDNLIHEIKPKRLLDWGVFLRILLVILMFPLVAKAVYGFLYRGELKHKTEIERAFRLFYVPKPGHNMDILGRPQLRKMCLYITVALLVGNTTMVICLLLGLSRVHSWLGADGNAREVLDGGNCVETVFPFLIYGYFAFQMALGYSIVVSEEKAVKKTRMEEARQEMEHASFWGKNEVRASVV